jgi:hypothetical protein
MQRRNNRLQVFVDGDRGHGQPSGRPAGRSDVIVVTYGTAAELPDPIPSTFDSPRSTPSGARWPTNASGDPRVSAADGIRPRPRDLARARRSPAAERRPWGVARFVAIAGFIALGWLLFFRTPGPGEILSERVRRRRRGVRDLRAARRAEPVAGPPRAR